MTPELKPTDEYPKRPNLNLETGWNHHFSSGIGSCTAQQKKEWEEKRRLLTSQNNSQNVKPTPCKADRDR